jgi:hypothetical protein
MRLKAALPIGAVALVCLASPAAAQPRSSIQGFGGLRLGGFASNDASFGGVVTSALTPSIQVVGEGGRIGNILSPTIDLALGLIPGDLGFRTSAWYGQGGVRISTSGSGVRPYLETQAGMARLQTRVTGLGSGTADALTNAALQFLDGTSAIATVGGGLTFSGGAFVTDIGYRYRRIFSDGWVNALSTGQVLDMNEVRIGVGVRF